MKTEMKQRYRKFKRGWGVYHVFDNTTGLSKSLNTRNKQEADILVHSKNKKTKESHNSTIDREQSWNKAADHCATVADPESVRLVSRHCLRQQAQSDLP